MTEDKIEAPIGSRVDSCPARRPGRTTLQGRLVALTPLNSVAHGDALYEGTRGEAGNQLWRYLFEGPFPDRDAFDLYLQRVDRQMDLAHKLIDMPHDFIFAAPVVGQDSREVIPL